MRETVLIFASCCLPSVLCANILFLFFHDTGSHQKSSAKYFTSLALARHHVTLFDTTSQSPGHYHPNVTSVSAYLPPYGAPEALAHRVWNHTNHGWHKPFGFARGDAHLGQLTATHSDKLSEMMNRRWALVVVDDLFTSHGYAVALLLKRLHPGNRYLLFGTSWRLSSADVCTSLMSPRLGLSSDSVTESDAGLTNLLSATVTMSYPRAAIFLVFLAKCALSADILFLFFHDTGSHQSSGSKYFISLAQAGHRVTILDTSYETPKVYHPNVHAVTAYMPPLDSPQQAAHAIWHRTIHGWHKALSFRKGEENFEGLLAMHSDKLAKLANHKWDLVVVDDLYNQPAYAFVVWRKRLLPDSKYAILRTSFRYVPTDVYYTLG